MEARVSQDQPIRAPTVRTPPMKLTDPREKSPPLLHLLSHTRPYIANDLKLDYKLDYKLDKNKRDALLAALALLPLYGPAVYLLLRPQLPNDDDRVT